MQNVLPEPTKGTVSNPGGHKCTIYFYEVHFHLPSMSGVIDRQEGAHNVVVGDKAVDVVYKGDGGG